MSRNRTRCAIAAVSPLLFLLATAGCDSPPGGSGANPPESAADGTTGGAAAVTPAANKGKTGRQAPVPDTKKASMKMID